MGRTRAVPLVKLDHSEDAHAVLQWYPVTKGSQAGGELLAAFELYLVCWFFIIFISNYESVLYVNF